MTALEIRSVHSPDVEVGAWEPEESGAASFLVEVELGERGTPGADVFQAMIATPAGLTSERRCSEAPALISCRALLVLPEFSWDAVSDAIESVVAGCAASDWADSVANLQTYFHHEYEDYGQAEGRGAATRLELRGLAAVDEPWLAGHEGDAERVRFEVEMEIGEREGLSENFRATVATPLGLERSRCSEHPMLVSSRALLLMPRFSWKTLNESVASILALCAAESSDEARRKLQRYLRPGTTLRSSEGVP